MPGPNANSKLSTVSGLWPVLLGFALLLGFFLAHQGWSTGFFKPNFGPVGTVLFYGTLFSGLTFPLGIPVWLNRKFGRRTELAYEISTALFWSASMAWLLVIFPLDFTQFTAVVPGPLKFSLSWVTNEVGRILLELFLVGTLAFIPFYAVQFRSGKRKPAVSPTIG